LKGLFILDKKEVGLENDYQNVAGTSTSMGKVNDDDELNVIIKNEFLKLTFFIVKSSTNEATTLFGK
jgi:hypothetical protein